MEGVNIPEACWHQYFDSSSHKFITLITEKRFCLRVDHHDRSLMVGDHHPIWRGFQQPAKSLLVAFLLHRIADCLLLLADQLLFCLEICFANSIEGNIAHGIHAMDRRE